MPNLSLVAFDLDGTVIDSVKRTVSERVQAALTAAHEQGALTCVSTARPVEFLGEMLTSFKWIDLYSVSDGAMVVEHASWQPILSYPLGCARALELMDYLADLDPLWELYATDACYNDAGFLERCAQRDDRKVPANVEVLREILRGMQEVPSTRELLEKGELTPIKLDPLFATPELADQAEHRLAQRSDYEFARMYDIADFELTDAGVNKGSAIAQIIDHYQLNPAEVVAFGDSGNDLSMTGHRYRFVAMDNATPQIKAAADEICPSIDDDGVAVWLERYLGL